MRRAVSLSGAVFALLCLAMILFALPAGAQDGRLLPGTPARGVDTGDDGNFPNAIVVAASGCTVTSSPPSITLEDDGTGRATFTDGRRGITVSTADANGRPRIEGDLDRYAEFIGEDPPFDFLVESSRGITGCSDEDDDEDTNPTRDQYAGDGEVDEGEVDIEEDVIVGTTSKKKIPNTGGPPLLLFGALLLGAAAVVGRVVLRP